MSSIQNFDNCTREQQEQLLNWFFYRVKADERMKLAADLPRAYNAFVGKAVMKVVHVDGTGQ